MNTGYNLIYLGNYNYKFIKQVLLKKSYDSDVTVQDYFLNTFLFSSLYLLLLSGQDELKKVLETDG